MEEGKNDVGEPSSSGATFLPPARVEAIANLQAEGVKFDKEAIQVVTKATELFLQQLGSQVKTDAWTYDDVAKAVREWAPSKDMLNDSDIIPLKVKVSDLIEAGILNQS